MSPRETEASPPARLAWLVTLALGKHRFGSSSVSDGICRFSLCVLAIACVVNNCKLRVITTRSYKGRSLYRLRKLVFVAVEGVFSVWIIPILEKKWELMMMFEVMEQIGVLACRFWWRVYLAWRFALKFLGQVARSRSLGASFLPLAWQETVTKFGVHWIRV